MRKFSERKRTKRLSLATISMLLLLVMAFSVIPATGAVSSLARSSSDNGIEIAVAPPAAASAAGLQTEIDRASSGTTILLPPGTYIGQLRIDKNLDLVGSGEGKTILQSPASMTPDSLGNVFVIEVGHGASVQISALTVRVTEQCMLANSIGVATGGGVGVRENSTLHISSVNIIAYGP